jgi:hypothetical protein
MLLSSGHVVARVAERLVLGTMRVGACYSRRSPPPSVSVEGPPKANYLHRCMLSIVHPQASETHCSRQSQPVAHSPMTAPREFVRVIGDAGKMLCAHIFRNGSFEDSRYTTGIGFHVNSQFDTGDMTPYPLRLHHLVHAPAEG